MSINYSTAICFGTIIPEEIAQDIIEEMNFYFEYDEIEDFIISHCIQINYWSGGDYFLGFVNWLEDTPVLSIDEIPQYNDADFYDMMNEWKISNQIRRTPQRYLITFCH